MRARRLIGVLTLLPLAAIAAACGGDASSSGSGPSAWTATTDTIADTVFVRTTSGSVWGPDARLVEEVRIGQFDGPEEYIFGEIIGLTVAPDGTIYLVDGQVPALRVYAPDGVYLRTIYGEGGGPGEYAEPDGGIALLPDGRLLLRDPGNARINVYSTEDEPLDTWPIPGGWATSTPLFVDTAGRTAVFRFSFTEDGLEAALVRHGPDGARLDSLPGPVWDKEPPALTATRETDDGWSRSSQSVPFAANGVWTFSPHGHFVSGFSDRYVVYLMREEPPVLAIGREREPVSLKADERQNHEERVVAMMRRVDPGWDWNGPPIPDTKPAFESLFVDLDGRIWVRVHVEAEEIPEDEREEPSAGSGRGPTSNVMIPAARWREPPVYDVFEPDGRFLGTLALPVRARLMQARGDQVWAIDRDELGVEFVVRYRIETP